MQHERTSPSPNRNGSESIIALLARQDSAQVQSIWQNVGICEYLVAPDSRRHTWHAWLAAHGTVDAADTYRFFTFAKSREILTDAFGDCPSGMISALGKLGPYAKPKHVYIALHKVLSAGGSLANYVHQSSRFDDDELAALASAAGLPVSNRVVRTLLKCKMPTQVLLELLWTMARLATMHPEQQVVRCIAQGRQPAAILANLLNLTPFPDPPFRQIGVLTPITTAQQLREAGKEFDNCLKNHDEFAYAIASVQSGQRYFYRWEGEHPTLLAFSKCGSAGWILSERSGRANSRVPQATMGEISDALVGAPNVFVRTGATGILEWICAR